MANISQRTVTEANSQPHAESHVQQGRLQLRKYTPLPQAAFGDPDYGAISNDALSRMHDQRFSLQAGPLALTEARSKKIAAEVQAAGRVLTQCWRAENGFLVLDHVYVGN